GYALSTVFCRLPFLYESRTLLRSFFRDSDCVFFPEIVVDDVVAEVNEWCEQNGHRELVDVVCNSDGDDLFRWEYSIECNEENNKTVDQLRYERRSCGAHPEPTLTRRAAESLEHKYVDELSEQECGERSDDDSLPLPEYSIEGEVH